MRPVFLVGSSRVHHANHRIVDRRLSRGSARRDVVERPLYVTDAALDWICATRNVASVDG